MQHFIADVHMRPHVRADRARFLDWFAGLDARTERIYCLGDLFEYWYTGLEGPCADVLAALADPRVRILTGNRDFLLRNCALPGILPCEETRITLSGRRMLVTHGHLLVRGDYGFKALHAVGWPLLRALDRLLPLAWKQAWAESLVRSSAAVRPPHGAIPGDIAQRKGVDTVICGHLHRGVIKPGLIVVPAFVDDGEWLVWDEGPAFARRG